VFRIVWFVLGLLIGTWIARPTLPTSPRKILEMPRAESDSGSADRFREASARRAPRRAPAKDTDVTPPAAPLDVRTFAAAPAGTDALIDIKGIGPVFVERLHAAGITTFAQLAAQTAETLATTTGASTERIRRERWIEQAREMSGK
jgi:large subunit ribosomal protein L21